MRVLLAILAVGLAAAGPARADSAPADPPGARLAGQHFGLSAGWGFGLPLPGPDKDTTRTRLIALTPRWMLPVCQCLGEGALRGRLALLGEGTFLLQHAPQDGHAAGGKVLLRYLFTGQDGVAAGVSPYIEGGGGGLYLDFGFEDQRDGFNFSIVGGLGLFWPLSERLALDTNVRFHHISNSGIRRPNVGLNALIFAAGISWRPALR